jgi:hypothetical protein
VRLSRVPVPYAINTTGLSEEEQKETNELNELLSDLESFNQRFQAYKEVAEEISLLILRIEMGEALDGKCDLCPRITIREPKQRSSLSKRKGKNG